MNIVEFLPYIVSFITLCGALGGILAFRPNYSKAASEIQQRVIDALTEESNVKDMRIKNLEEKVKTLEEEKIKRLEQVVTTIRYALKRYYGLAIRVNDDFVMIEEMRSGRSRTTPIQNPQPLPHDTFTTPGTSNTEDDDDDDDDDMDDVRRRI